MNSLPQPPKARKPQANGAPRRPVPRHGRRDFFLEALREEGEPVDIHLSQWDAPLRDCRILDYDAYTILIELPNRNRRMVFKHAIVYVGWEVEP